ncbi:hypothetical protein Z043_114721, partial [Scleropages formosus]
SSLAEFVPAKEQKTSAAQHRLFCPVHCCHGNQSEHGRLSVIPIQDVSPDSLQTPSHSLPLKGLSKPNHSLDLSCGTPGLPKEGCSGMANDSEVQQLRCKLKEAEESLQKAAQYGLQLLDG